MMRLLHELKRRNVFRVATGYVALSWLVIQIAETVLPAFDLEGTVRIVVLLAAAGLVPVVALAWAFELTPEGLKLDREAERNTAAARRLDKRLDRVAIVILALAVGYFAFDKFVLDPARDEALRQETLDRAGAGTAAGPRLENTLLVTEFPGVHREPTLAPDGRRMAFVSTDGVGVAQIWVMSLPDGEPVQLTRGALPASSPSWSPTEDEILFQRATEGDAPSLWLVDALGTREPRIVVRDAGRARFAPDGRSFVFSRGQDIWFGFPDGSPPRRLEGMPRTQGFASPMPAVNADGDVVFVLADEGPVGDLWLYESAGETYRRLTRSEGEWSGIWAQSPVWMPDGRTVLYTAPDGETSSNMHLWSIDTQTGNTAKLSSGPGGYSNPAVSRDGSRLVYAHTRSIFHLIATDPRSGDERTILATRSPVYLPAVSPDGRTTVYFGEHVYTVPVAGGRAEQRTFGPPGEATLPTWSRSDGSIWYHKGRSLQRLDPGTGLSELVLEDFHWSREHWLTVHGDRLAYEIRGPEPAYVRDLQSGREVVLEDGVSPMQWSRDGERLLAVRWSDETALICEAPDFRCAPVGSGAAPLRGVIPRWSADESRVFVLRARPEDPGLFEVWSAPAAGGEARREGELSPFSSASSLYDIAEDDQIVWNSVDAAGVSEIWMSDDLGGFASESADPAP